MHDAGIIQDRLRSVGIYHLPPSQVSRVRFVMDEAAVGQVFLRVLQCSPIGIIPPVPYTHILIYLSPTPHNLSN